GEAKTRRNIVKLRCRPLAVTAAARVTENQAARQIARGRMQDSRIEIRGVLVRLLARHIYAVAQAEIQRQVRRYFPIVLREACVVLECPSRHVPLNKSVTVVQIAQQET